jgi:hypothetical protein
VTNLTQHPGFYFQVTTSGVVKVPFPKGQLKPKPGTTGRTTERTTNSRFVTDSK